MGFLFLNRNMTQEGKLIHTDGKPTIAMRESEKTGFQKTYREENDKYVHFVIFEVEGELNTASDFVSTVEKLELEEISSVSVLPLERFTELIAGVEFGSIVLKKEK